MTGRFPVDDVIEQMFEILKSCGKITGKRGEPQAVFAKGERTMQIRRGCEADTERLVALAGQIFETEQEIPRALTPLPPENHPQWWCVEEDGALLGGVALYWEDNAWHMGRFVISPELRGRHVGTVLLETALTDIFAQDIREVTMEARDTTVHILKKFGAETTGAPFSFYRGTVTPMRLTREAFWNSHTGGQI